MRNVIFNADDFGVATEVNEAVERAHRDGILRSASLMVAAPATGDAVSRALRLPTLAVGLHLVLVNGQSVLPPARIPALVNPEGCFRSNLFEAGVRYFFSPAARRELEAEIRAQFDRFAATGLPLDHVNAQNHMHVHPTILSAVLRIARDYGARAVRVPHEPFWPSWRATGCRPLARFANAALLGPWLALMRARLHAAGFTSNDYVFGINDSGHMTSGTLRAFLCALPAGTTEIYLHPAMRSWAQAWPPDYDYAGEYAALVDPAVAQTLAACGASPVSFRELAARGA